MNKFLKNDTDSKLKGWTEITGTAKRIGMDGDIEMKNGNKMWILDGQIASVENVALAKERQNYSLEFISIIQFLTAY